MSERSILKNNKISCFADEIDSSIDKQIALLKELGIGYVEFRSGDGKGIASYTLEEAEALKKRFDAEGLGFSAAGSPVGKIDITDDFAPHFETYKHICEMTKIWETPYIRMFSFFIPEGANADDFRDEVLKRTAEMVEYAAAQNITLLHENEKGIYGDNAVRCLDLMKEFYGANYKCTFDFANFVQCGQDTLEAFEMLKDYVEYVHVKDALMADGSVVPAGQGDGNVKKILTALDERGFAGILSLEPHLADFAGLAGLEKDVQLRGRSDTEVAFVTAYRALQGLLA